MRIMYVAPRFHTNYIANGSSGFVFQTDDEASLAERMLVYLKDPQLVSVHGINARKLAETEYGFDAYYRGLREMLAHAKP